MIRVQRSHLWHCGVKQYGGREQHYGYRAERQHGDKGSTYSRKILTHYMIQEAHTVTLILHFIWVCNCV